MGIEQPLVVAPVDLGVFIFGRSSGEMVIEMDLVFEGRLDEHLLALAVQFLLDAEPVLGCRLVADSLPPRWQPVPRANRRGLLVTEVLEEYQAARRNGLDPTTNVQIALCLLRREDGDRLLIKMTHEVGDGRGLQFLTAHLGSIYSKLCADASYRPRPNLEAQRDFGQLLSRVPMRVYPRAIWDFVRFMIPRSLPRRTHTLSLPGEGVGPWTPVFKRVPSSRVCFLSTYAKARGATLNDVFLAAAYRALASSGEWHGTSGLRISITVDLRRRCLSLPDATSVCNLSSFEYPYLVRNLGRNFEETLANVAALTRRRKESWPGLVPAIVGHFAMTLGGYADRLRPVARAQSRRRVRARGSLTLSNEGPLDKALLRFGAQTPVAAHILPPFLTPPNVHFCLSGYDGTLTLAAVTRENAQPALESFLDTLVERLPSGERAP